ncbi:MAG: hypothetical protein HKN43_13005 [Rhodothermales bacterium]|nr:hypothetical protein [Rhodothermales bacterium]
MINSSTYPNVRRLICVAGPPCSGKTFALRALQKGENPQLSAILGITDPQSWLAFAPGWLPPECPPELDRAFFHYDILRIWKFGGQGGQFAKDRALHLLAECESLEFVTLLTTTDTLRQRFAARPMLKMMARTLIRPGEFMKMMVCYFRMHKLYRAPEMLSELYTEWFEFTGQFNPKAHYVVDSSDGYSAVDVEEMVRYLSSEKRPQKNQVSGI